MASENFKPTYEEIQQAVTLYDSRTPNNDYDYNSAISDIESNLSAYTESSAEEIVAALMRILDDWIRPNINPNQSAMAKIIDTNRENIELARSLSIKDINISNESLVLKLFRSLVTVHGLGGSSAGICLHLLAPSFFPSWNKDIAEAYVFAGEYMAAESYWAFMLEVKKRIEYAYGSHPIEDDVFRRIDKFNYCRIHNLM